MKALSVRQPWAWLIIHGGKDIENRTWATRHRGPLLIHAASGLTRQEYERVGYYAGLRGVLLPPMCELQRGGIVGSVEVEGMTERALSAWFMGPIGWQLASPKPLPFRAMKGRLGLFEVQL